MAGKKREGSAPCRLRGCLTGISGKPPRTGCPLVEGEAASESPSSSGLGGIGLGGEGPGDKERRSIGSANSLQVQERSVYFGGRVTIQFHIMTLSQTGSGNICGQPCALGCKGDPNKGFS